MTISKEAIEIMGEIAEKVYDPTYLSPTSIGMPIEDLPGYEVLAISPESSNGFQALLLKKIDPNVEGSQYVFAFRGTEVVLNVVETWRDLIQTDVLGMGLQNVPGQFLEAIMFVKELMALYPGMNQENTTLTGHSLGGAIATAVSYTFGMQAYGYNPFGIADNDLFQTSTIGDIFELVGRSVIPPTSLPDGLITPEWANTMAAIIGVDSAKFSAYLNSTQSVTGIVTENVNVVTVGKDYQELVSGVITDIVGGLIGSFNPVMDYDGGSLGGFAAHGITALNQGIAVFNNLLTLFPQDDYSSLTASITFVPGDDPVRRFLLELSEIVGAGNLATLDTVAMAQKVAETGTTNLQLFNLGDKDVATLGALSPENKAELYALVHLNSFVVQGANLPAYQGLDPTGFSDQYFEDRAHFLYHHIHSNQPSHEAFPVQYTDITTQKDAWSGERTTLFDNARYTFGSDAGDTLPGQSKDDHLYGMGGDDILYGYAGNDYLEGGKGQDTLLGGDNDDTFVVIGTDADYDTFDGGADIDTIRGGDGDDTIRLHDFNPASSVEFIDGHLGYNIIAGTDLNDTIDLSQTIVLNIDKIDGGGGVDKITGSAGNDTIYGGAGGDTLNGGGGENWLYGGTGMDTYIVGEGSTISSTKTASASSRISKAISSTVSGRRARTGRIGISPAGHPAP